MNRLSVVIPAWNEEEAIANVIGRLVDTGPALEAVAGITDLEVIVVDDGSTDKTRDIVTAVAAAVRDGRAQVRLLRHSVNRGYGAALQHGLSQARGQLLAFLDADCTYPPEELPTLCKALVDDPRAAFVVGNRMGHRASGMPPTRRLGNVFFAGLVSLLGRRRIADCCSGMRVLRPEALETLGELPDGLDYTPAMTMRALHKDMTVLEVPISYHERVGRSKLKVLRDGCRFLGTILHETLAHRPARLWSVVTPAIALGALGLLSAVVSLLGAGPYLWPGWGLMVFVSTYSLLAGALLACQRARARIRPATTTALPGMVSAVAEQMDEKRSANLDEYVAVGEREPVAARTR